jgi:hypothetical protein
MSNPKDIGPNLGHRVEKIDPIIDRSDEQKRLRVDEMRLELAEYGYSIVTTRWLGDVLRTNEALRVELGRAATRGYRQRRAG